jgi:hypothetical protein
MAKPIEIPTAKVTAAGESVAAQIAMSARPAPVPPATGGSPIDGAAAAVAGAIIAKVAASSADLAPESAEFLAKTETAVAELNAKDGENASKIKAVPEGMHEQAGAGGAGAVQPASSGLDDWENFSEGSFELPGGPAGAGPGPSVIPGTGVPDELI